MVNTRKKTNIGIDDSVVKPVLFKLLVKVAQPATEKRYYPGLKNIPSTDDIYDPSYTKNGKLGRRSIRYSESEESIYKDEQSRNVVLSDIIFTNGSLKVYPDNPLLIKYLRECNWNIDNKNRIKGKEAIFYEYNPETVAQRSLENEESSIDAGYKALHMEFNDLKNIARAMSININRSAQEIRHDVVTFAKNHPTEFNNALNSPDMQRKVEIMDAIELGILLYNNRIVKLKGADQDTDIVTVPIGVDMVEFLTDWTLRNKDGEDFYEKVIKLRKKMLD